MTAAALPRIAALCARGIAPRRVATVSEWAAAERVLVSKGSAITGRWSNDRNPCLREPMDALSRRSRTHESVNIFPIQFGKTEIELNALGYTMDVAPGPTMVVLPDDITMNAWIDQKLTSLIDGTPAVRRALTSTSSRNASNQKAFKDFSGGQLFIEHAKTATRLTLKSIETVLVDELDKFAGQLQTGEDPLELIRGRVSAFPSTYRIAYIGTPGIKGVSRLEALYEESDQRRYYVPCPHCGHRQALEWSGLVWSDDADQCWYACRDCGAAIEEHHKTAMIRAGEWVAERPGQPIRGYRLNCLYYPVGMGPRWLDLVRQWKRAQSDPQKLQVFVQERLAEAWEDPAMRRVKHDQLRARAEHYELRTAPHGVLAITAGVDTQDNRLAVQIVGWGRNLHAWTLDYVELPGDPAEEVVWASLIDLLTRPITHACGATMHVEAVAIDAGGHRTNDVYAFVRSRRLRRAIAVFGAVQANAPALGKGKLVDVNWRGQLDKRGVMVHHVGTVGIKHKLYSRLAVDAEPKRVDGKDVAKEPEDRFIHATSALPDEFFPGLVSEIYNPVKNRFEHKTGTRNEPLDTWVYAFAAAHHPELRLHRRSTAEWDAAERAIGIIAASFDVPRETKPQPRADETAPRAPRRGGWVGD